MSASDYKVSFPYGATTAPYSPSSPHRGNDRACLTGTSVVIGSVTIGITGSTGLTTGPHLHTQAGRDEWAQTTIDPTGHEFKPGVVVKTGTGSQWGKYVCVKTGDVNVFYCHLSSIKVTVNQTIGGSMNQEEVDKLYKSLDATNKRVDVQADQIDKAYKALNTANRRLDALETSTDTGGLDLATLRIVKQ